MSEFIVGPTVGRGDGAWVERGSFSTVLQSLRHLRQSWRLIAPPRVGKSSFLKQLRDDLRAEGIRVVRAEVLRDDPSEKSLATRLAQGLGLTGAPGNIADLAGLLGNEPVVLMVDEINRLMGREAGILAALARLDSPTCRLVVAGTVAPRSLLLAELPPERRSKVVDPMAGWERVPEVWDFTEQQVREELLPRGDPEGLLVGLGVDTARWIHRLTLGHPYFTQALAEKLCAELGRGVVRATTETRPSTPPLTVTPAQVLELGLTSILGGPGSARSEVFNLVEDFLPALPVSVRMDMLVLLQQVPRDGLELGELRRRLSASAELQKLVPPAIPVVWQSEGREELEEARTWLYLLGVLWVDGDSLSWRNPLYAAIFNEEWIRTQLAKLNKEWSPDLDLWLRSGRRAGLLGDLAWRRQIWLAFQMGREKDLGYTERAFLQVLRTFMATLVVGGGTLVLTLTLLAGWGWWSWRYGTELVTQGAITLQCDQALRRMDETTVISTKLRSQVVTLCGKAVAENVRLLQEKDEAIAEKEKVLAEKEKLEAELHSLENTRNEQQARLTMLLTQVAAGEAQVQRKNSELANVQRSYDQQREQLAASEAQLATSAKELEASRNALASSEKRLEALNQELEKVRSQVSQGEEEFAALQQKLKAARADLEIRQRLELVQKYFTVNCMTKDTDDDAEKPALQQSIAWALGDAAAPHPCLLPPSPTKD